MQFYIQLGWPDKCPDSDEWRPYITTKHELGVVENYILWEKNIVLPLQWRKQESLYEGNSGMIKMKYLSRKYFWWPNLDMDIEFKVRNCYKCQMISSMLTTAPLQPWEMPQKEWSRLHIKYASTFKRNVPCDSRCICKWIDVYIIHSAIATSIIENLQGCLATHGILDTMVSDNVSSFINEEFQSYTSRHGIEHVATVPPII